MQIAQKAGLHEVGRYDVLSGPPTDAADSGARVRLAHAGDLDMLGRMLLGRQADEDPPDFYTEGWTAYQLDTQRLRLLVAVHAVAIAECQDEIGVGIATASVVRPRVRLGYLHGARKGMTALAGWIQTRAGAAGLRGVRAILPSEDATRELLRPLGFTASGDFSMVLWETRL